MKHSKHYTLFLFFLLLSSCCVYSPWYRIEYINERIDERWGSNIPPNVEKYSNLYIQNAFVIVFLTAHNWTNEPEEPPDPFSLYVTVMGKKNEHDSVTIYNAEIKSNLNRKHEIVPAKTDLNNKIVETFKFPLKLFFSESTDREKYTSAHFHSSYTLNFDYKNNEKLTVIIDLEVTSKSGSERKKIIYNFIPKKESGWLSCWTT